MFTIEDLFFIKCLIQNHLQNVLECINECEKGKHLISKDTDLEVLNYGKNRCLDVIHKIDNYEKENRNLLH